MNVELLLISALVVSCLAEPPVGGGYPGGPPSTSYGTPVQRQTDAVFSRPSTEFIPPRPFSFGGTSQQQSSAPSAEYGVPGQGFGTSDSFSSGESFKDQSRQYLPPGASPGGDDSNEPNYSFSYMVKDEPSGNDFGHRESRHGEKTEGQYYVLLPDGRKQIVKYVADEDGFHPSISYEDTGMRPGRYGRGSQGGYNYENQRGPY